MTFCFWCGTRTTWLSWCNSFKINCWLMLLVFSLALPRSWFSYAYFRLTFFGKTLRVDMQHSLSRRMIFGVQNRIDTGVVPYESPWQTDFTVIFLELCGARKTSEKIKQKEDLHFFLLAIAVPVLGLIKKASLNGCFWIGFWLWER